MIEANNITLRHIGPFSFVPLYEFLQEALQNTTDPYTSPYFRVEGNWISITNDVCLQITNSTHDSWTIYDNAGIWNRIVTWKLPLVTLLFQFARPPFAWRLWTNTNVFILLHLVGDPLNTITSLLTTLSACQRRVKTIQARITHIHHDLQQTNPSLAQRIHQTQPTLTKTFSLLSISYSEWNVPNAEPFLLHSLARILAAPSTPLSQAALHHFETAASALAADRSTYVLPIFIAQFAFIFAIGAAYWRVVGVPPQPQSWTNVEAYAIAMSAPFLHVVPAVFLGAIIGVPQTETSVPRVLDGLRERLVKEGWMEVGEVGGILLGGMVVGLGWDREVKGVGTG
ncbi:hypothetical protein B0T17DRAFT_614045 [Bombardia bombarda]|uniref:Uncharacterized protein n=1 Tax=Bombardia bombarda TaxID=252184 RepID=A0AA39XNU1_9PEZI|nr:hypothetical protein B0T17DRAFT_614045 [Bombardia bombarda]